MWCAMSEYDDNTKYQEDNVHIHLSGVAFHVLCVGLGFHIVIGCEEVGVVKRVHTLSGGVHRLATALKVVEEVQEEVQEINDEWEDEEVEDHGLKVEREPHTSCVDEMTCSTPLSHAVHCVNQ